MALEIRDAQGRVVRRFTNADAPPVVDFGAVSYPAYWLGAPQILGAGAGHHRFAWDLRYAPPAGVAHDLSITAVGHRTPPGPFGPFVAPGRYTVALTVDGVAVTQPLIVRLDPRVTTPLADIARQTALSMRAYAAFNRLATLGAALDARLQNAGLAETQRTGITALRGRARPTRPTRCTAASPPPRQTPKPS